MRDATWWLCQFLLPIIINDSTFGLAVLIRTKAELFGDLWQEKWKCKMSKFGFESSVAEFQTRY